jgi:hypothetical protein
MSTQQRPPLRSAPSPDALQRQQEAALAQIQSKTSSIAHLEALDAWTEEPLAQPPAATPVPAEPREKRAGRKRAPEPPAAVPVVAAAPEPEVVPEVPAAPKMPWEEVGEKETHAYHVVLPKSLFLKMDYIWKRSNHPSARAYVISILTEAADKAIAEEKGA